MKTFQDITREFPGIVTQNTNTREGSSDMLTRWYNMYWGSLTDTHMQLMDDGNYVIIGSKLTKSLWNQIMFSRRLSIAPNTILPSTWNDVLKANKLEYAYSTHNGAFAIAVGLIDKENPGLRELIIPQPTTINTPYIPTCGPCCSPYFAYDM